MSFSQILALVPQALWESIYMTLGSTALAYVIACRSAWCLWSRPRTGYTRYAE